MKNITGKQRNLIFYSFLSVALVLVLILAVVGSTQNGEWTKEDAMHKHAFKNLRRGNFDEAIPLYKHLLEQKRNQNSPNLYWEYGGCLAGKKEYPEALKNYELAKEKNIFLVKDSNFMYQWSHLLAENGQDDKAYRYLTLARQEASDEKIAAQMDTLLQKIENKK
ncbi:hypothetical protein SAMN00017405_1875 [Desulfonispora thiosulfatigenes DSM 11270]|uniref:Tetratricopeptide repeat-containing protein n=1 Tax=Desulfonispora thiosulfatigenes DSM 11270 TaxID=656914 RepID=A0A1W1V4G6_DESTI|nr:tetratricopeptide repeat protein [Desulfonispora thiosulfatigenes]SMB88289.1 hypothetical protein SAMN00017405_1875 [Desulfonispora thiosulfatigenes DSM 11270]